MDRLPVILICAVNDTVAADVISELVDNDVSSEYAQEPERRERVWRLVNKYYTADVRVRTLTDDERPLAPRTDDIEAQVIHITEQELSGESGGVGEAEARAADGAWRQAAVRCVLVDCARELEAGALCAWCAAPPHALLVPRRERAPADRAPLERGAFAEAHGVHCLRDALHAHTWRNLRRTDGAADGAPVSLDEEPSPEQQRLLVEQTQVLADALQAAGELRGAGDAARLERAESVLLALCRAAGLRPDELD